VRTVISIALGTSGFVRSEDEEGKDGAVEEEKEEKEEGARLYLGMGNMERADAEEEG